MLPKYCSISVLCILLLITPLYGLHCYDCEDCLNNNPDTEQCDGSENACIVSKNFKFVTFSICIF